MGRHEGHDRLRAKIKYAAPKYCFLHYLHTKQTKNMAAFIRSADRVVSVSQKDATVLPLESGDRTSIL